LGSLLLHIENSDCGQLFEDRLTELVNALLEIVKQTTWRDPGHIMVEKLFGSSL
jgi:hypothetical protein